VTRRSTFDLEAITADQRSTVRLERFDVPALPLESLYWACHDTRVFDGLVRFELYGYGFEVRRIPEMLERIDAHVQQLETRAPTDLLSLLVDTTPVI
jgi:hypothetical protein